MYDPWLPKLNYKAREQAIYYLVDLINQDQRVSCSNIFKALNHLSWHSTNIGSAMSLNAIFVKIELEEVATHIPPFIV